LACRVKTFLFPDSILITRVDSRGQAPEVRWLGFAAQSGAEVKKLTPKIVVLATVAGMNVNRVTAASGGDAYDTEGNGPEEWQA